MFNRIIVLAVIVILFLGSCLFVHYVKYGRVSGHVMTVIGETYTLGEPLEAEAWSTSQGDAVPTGRFTLRLPAGSVVTLRSGKHAGLAEDTRAVVLDDGKRKYLTIPANVFPGPERTLDEMRIINDKSINGNIEIKR